MNIIKCYLTTSKWLRNCVRNGYPVGILWHDTGAGNPNIARYVQPADNDANKDNLIKILGKNANKNDWNHVSRDAGVNAFIGKIADGSVATCLTSDFDVHPWGCACGKNGSLNGYTSDGVYIPEFYYQFELCDSGYGYDWYDKEADTNYFNAVYQEACELTAYICREFNIDPMGYNDFCGQKVPTIVCHRDSYDYGLGNQHGDVYVWFEKFGKTMDDVRKDVKRILEDGETSRPYQFKLLDEVKIKSGVTKWASGANISGWVFNSKLYVRAINENKITVSTLKSGAITGTLYVNDIELINQPIVIEDCDTDADEPVEPEEKNPFAIGDKVILSECANTLYGSNIDIPVEIIEKCLYVHENRFSDRIKVGLFDCEGECEQLYELAIEDVVLCDEDESIDDPVIQNHTTTETDDDRQDAINTPIYEFKVGDEVFINQNAEVFSNGEKISSVVKYWKPYIIDNCDCNEVTIRIPNSDITYVLNIEDVALYQAVKDNITIGDIVTINSDALDCDGQKISLWTKFKTWVVEDINDDKAKIGFDIGGKINLNTWIYIKDLKEVKPYLAKITHAKTNVRNRASILSSIIDVKFEDDIVVVYGTSGLWYCIGENQWSFILFVNKC